MQDAILTSSDDLKELIAAEPEPPSLPGVYEQPVRTAIRRGSADVEMLVRQWLRALCRQETNAAMSARYALEQEFTPLITWALSSWDFLLTTEGCRFLLRKPGERLGVHGDYRAVESSDYHRLVIHCFRDCLSRFAEESADVDLPLTQYLPDQLWPTIAGTYRALSQPPDARQRLLTSYSYLRCVPYAFFNAYHQRRVARAVARLAQPERHVIDLYYLHFFTEIAVADAQHIARTTMHAYRRRALRHIAHADHLSYALLLQIARY